MKQKVAEQVIFHNKSSLNDENSGIPNISRHKISET
jgi:hypothetical protein